jgi:hypothetical protein
MKRLTRVMYIAIPAALLLVGGAVAQGQLTGQDIRNNSITGKDVRNKSLTRADFRGSVRGPRGRTGSQGALGPPGPPGPQGARGPAGATNVTVRVGPEVADTSTASCASGERAVGGGGIATGPDGVLWASNPAPTSGTPTAWEADAVVRATGAPDFVQAYVICAAP